MAEKRKRYTIGVLVSGILDEFTKYVCKGVLQGAKSADVNVVVVPGKYLDRDLSDKRELFYEYQYSTLFSYLNKENVDALIVSAGSIGCFTSEKRIREMLGQYDGIPCILLASQLDGYVSVMFDNYQGVKEGLEYLITHKGCRKFGMIGGSLENTDAYERRRAFVEVLESHGIAFEESMYVEGDFTRRCSTACQKLLEDNPDLEAVFCVNDETTIGLYEELRRRGLQAGRDLYVFGYDDTVVAAKIHPSLSSVRADPGKLGEEAVRMAVRLLHDGTVKSSIVPTRFVKRDSVMQPGVEDGNGIAELADGSVGFEDVFYWYLHEEAKEQLESLRFGYEKMIGSLLKGFAPGTAYLEECLDIMHSVDGFLSLGGIEYADMDKLVAVFEDIYRLLRERLEDDQSRFALRNLFASIYKKLILAMNSQSADMKEKKEEESFEMKLFVQNTMQWENGRDQSYGLLLSNLGWMHIMNACIYMLPKPELHLFGEEFTQPLELNLKAILWDGQVHMISPDQQKRPIGDLFDNPCFPAKERFERILLPLFSNETVYGVLLCDMDESLFLNGEFLVNQVSAAIRMMHLLRMNEQIQQQLEENLAALKMHNIELNTISKSDMLTGILNRRGFFDEAQSMMERCQKESKRVLILYVDMNNLKIINDRYGHEEGDFSLKLIGRILMELADQRGISGRIGGDEYACVIEYPDEDYGKKMLVEIHDRFETFNASSDKVYNVTVSVGANIVEPGEHVSLEEALARADDKLYMEKQNRKKEVAKQ